MGLPTNFDLKVLKKQQYGPVLGSYKCCILATEVTVGPLADDPVPISCPKCHQTVLSKVEYSSGLLTYLFCAGLFLCGFVLGCCLIPFCVNRLKDTKRVCPTGKSILGVDKCL
uniref:LITAF domain-containing protein n=1 Tax=Nothobranchius furzeri TaxID=105023 RepID=A0A8C6L1A9_NOTFU